MPSEKGKLNAGGQWVKTIFKHIKDMLPASETEIYRNLFEMNGLLPDKVDDFLIDLCKMGYVKNKKDIYYLIEIPIIEDPTTEEEIDEDLKEWRELKAKKQAEKTEKKKDDNGDNDPS